MALYSELDPEYSQLFFTWTCPRCTLGNSAGTEACTACGSLNPHFLLPPEEGVVEFQPKPGGSLFSTLTGERELRWSCPRCSWQNDDVYAICEACGFRALNVVHQEVLVKQPFEVETDSISKSVGKYLKNKFVSTQETKPRTKPKTTSVDAAQSERQKDKSVNGWRCPYCTFVNHCDLLYCEECRNAPGSKDHLPVPSDYLTPVPIAKSPVSSKVPPPPPRPSYSPGQTRKPKPERPKNPPIGSRGNSKSPNDGNANSPISRSSSNDKPPLPRPTKTPSPRPTKTPPPKTPLPRPTKTPPPKTPPPKTPPPKAPPPRPTKTLSPKNATKLSKQSSPDLSIKPKRPERPPALNQRKKASSINQTPSMNQASSINQTSSVYETPSMNQISSVYETPCPNPLNSSYMYLETTGTILTPANNSPGQATSTTTQKAPIINPKKPVLISSVLLPSSIVSTDTNNHLSKPPIDSSSDEEYHEVTSYQHQGSQSSQTVEDIKQIEESCSMAIWYNIVDQYKNNRESFIDPEFPLSKKSLFLIPNKPIKRFDVARWARPHDIRNVGSGKWCVLSYPKTSDIAQGVLGNCWFLSALAVVAECPGIIQHIIITKEWCPEGVYQVRLCQDGQWRIFIVDDYFPVDSYNQLVFSKARRKQLWVPLIEKALAKMYGCYEALQGGQVIEGLQALTGYPCEKFRLRRDSDIHDTDFDYAWTRLLSFKEARFPMAACTITDDNMLEEFGKVRLKPYHAYSILDFKQEGSEKMILLRDPWGNEGNNSGHNWWRSYSNRGDGRFWIGAWDFYKFFKEVDICHYLPDWHCFRTKASLPLYASSHQPVFHFHVFDETEVTINITQPSARYSSLDSENAYTDMCIMVLKLPPGVHNSTESLPLPVECVAVSQSHVLPCVTCDVFLSPGRYAILPLSFKDWYKNGRQISYEQQPSTNTNCVMAVFSSKILECDENISTKPGFMRESICLCAKKYGKLDEPGCDVRLRTLQLLPSLYVVMCENNSRTSHVSITCDCNESLNVLSTRKALKSHDIIPPGHKQILAVLSQCSYMDPVIYKFSFSLQTSFLISMDKWGAVNEPVLDKINSELHQAYPLTQRESINGHGINRTTVPPSDCRIS